MVVLSLREIICLIKSLILQQFELRWMTIFLKLELMLKHLLDLKKNVISLETSDFNFKGAKYFFFFSF